MTDDAELLRRYSADRSEDAFGELVRRHVDLVYSAALRRTAGDPHRAQEVTQMVFINLARKAAALVRHPVLPAWLHRTTAFAAADARRREARRSTYERAAAADALALGASGGELDWNQIRPVLDEAIDQLAERDREAIVLRFFGNRPFAEVGKRLGLSENAARMRVDRALDKLKARLASRGVHSSAAALALGLSAQTMAAAPAGMATAATAAAMAAGPSTAAFLTFMTATKFPLTLLGSVLVIGTSALVVQQNALARMRAELSALSSSQDDLDSLRSQNTKLAQSVKNARSLLDRAAQLPALLDEQKSLTAKIITLVRQQAAATPKAPIGQVFEPSQLDQPPRATAQARPAFPFEMRRAGLSGRVLVDFVVDSTGAVQNAFAAESTQKEFESAATQAVSQWTFAPGQKNGATVATHMQVPIVFTVNNNSAPTAATGPGEFNTNTAKTAAPGPSDWFPSNGK